MLDLEREKELLEEISNWSVNSPIPLKSPKVIAEVISTLNEDQLKAFYKIMETLQDPSKEYFSLEGYAGTGKTYLISRIVQCIDGRVALSAPTNKAVKVLYDNRVTFNNDGEVNKNIVYATIHKLLALRVKWIYPPKGSDKEPEQILVRNPRSSPTVNEYLLLIIDEASMLDDNLFEMLNAKKNTELKILFMGDPAQIPPINRLDSIPLIPEKRKQWKIEHAVLEKIMRQKSDNKILETAYQIRNGRFDKRDPLLSRISNKDVSFYSSLTSIDKQAFIEIMISYFVSEEFNTNPNYCKVIAWTNKMVNVCNGIIRHSIYKELPQLSKIMLGEKLIANKPIFDRDHNIIFNTSEEFTVEEFEIKNQAYSLPEKGNELLEQLEMDMLGTEIPGVNKAKFNFKYYSCNVRYKDNINSKGQLVHIEILHEDSEKTFWFMMKKLKARKNWDEYTQNVEKFADVKYNYAITCHKAQGSTYDTVFLMEDDIDLNHKTVERNRIKYTACTRPEKELYILSKHNPNKEQQNEYIKQASDSYRHS